ncbi:secreted RxLR effector protein 161-like [Quercus suber]|uniref:secreted RxLR effector protein 161-like n=1 Tax=Quercus suber TaxID=58331 RepID=UPI0032DFF527
MTAVEVGDVISGKDWRDQRRRLARLVTRTGEDWQDRGEDGEIAARMARSVTMTGEIAARMASLGDLCPRSVHYAAILRILRYVKGTLYHGLHYSSRSSLELHAYSDADWAGDPTDRWSITGFCFLLGTSLVSWRSKKQDVVSRSSTEAEYRALADTTCELVWRSLALG